MQRTYPRLISEIIEDALKAEGVSTTFKEQQACHLWPEIVGQGINRYTSRRYIDRGVMHVYLTSAALKQELAFHRARLVEQINERVGAHVVDEIVFH